MLFLMESTIFLVILLLINPHHCEPDCWKDLNDASTVQAQNCLKLGMPIIQQMMAKNQELDKTDDPTPDELATYNLEMYGIMCSDQGKRAIQCQLDFASSTCPQAFTYAKSIPYFPTTPAMDTAYILHFGSVDAICSGHEKSYADEVRDLFNRLQMNFPSTSKCIAKANTTKNQFVGKYNDDKQYAVALINLYAQECSLPSSGAVYRKINSVLRNGNSEQPWKQAGDLIDRGLDILGQETVSVVYRGCRTPVTFTSGSEYMFSQIISTSLDPKVALLFGCFNGYQNSQENNLLNTFFEIRNARGVRIDKYSAMNNEEEFLMQSVSSFFVVNTTDDSQDIKKKIDEIVVHGYQIYPAVYVTLDTVCTSKDTSAADTSAAATFVVRRQLILVFFCLYVNTIIEI
ncbi:uncharacterized protein LOC123535371 [Mercenaria mercenaria]|uniref:uncharacterized protein LOC123535371 n=1 Tax=Mercenaria mercenaria TaxID=6596 RepID=UPI00234EE513|nr:uncharacterized protein LOC123535371 [Mercenaria mercenaria]